MKKIFILSMMLFLASCGAEKIGEEKQQQDVAPESQVQTENNGAENLDEEILPPHEKMDQTEEDFASELNDLLKIIDENIDSDDIIGDTQDGEE